MNGRTNERRHARTHTRTDGWMDALVSMFVSIHFIVKVTIFNKEERLNKPLQTVTRYSSLSFYNNYAL